MLSANVWVSSIMPTDANVSQKEAVSNFPRYEECCHTNENTINGMHEYKNLDEKYMWREKMVAIK